MTQKHKRKKKHFLSIEKYKGNLKELSRDIHGMRYDAVAELYGHIADELRRQAVGDAERGRAKLAGLLLQAAGRAEDQQLLFQRIYMLCEPYMRDE